MRADEATSVEVLDVYKGDAQCGTLSREKEATVFRYHDDYLVQNLPAVASTLPLGDRTYRSGGGSVPPFFAGLLPEGVRLQAVIDAVKTSPDDELSLLAAVGSDTVGDVRLVPSGETPDEERPDLPTSPETESFNDLFGRSIDPTRDALDRALPGVQEKVSDAMISFPVKGHRGPAILKLEPQAYPGLLDNEAFFLGLAREAGFQVPAFELVRDRHGTKGLLVARFDRLVDADGAVIRIAQEDACQILGQYPAAKYRVSMQQVTEAYRRVASSPLQAVLDLILQVAFAYLIGNGDLHAKNLSLQWLADERLVRPTPIYDVLSTAPYPLNQRLALAVDGRGDNLKGHQLIRFGERYGLSPRILRRRLGDLAARVRDGLADIGASGLSNEASDRILRLSARRTNDLLDLGSA